MRKIQWFWNILNVIKSISVIDFYLDQSGSKIGLVLPKGHWCTVLKITKNHIKTPTIHKSTNLINFFNRPTLSHQRFRIHVFRNANLNVTKLISCCAGLNLINVRDSMDSQTHICVHSVRTRQPQYALNYMPYFKIQLTRCSPNWWLQPLETHDVYCLAEKAEEGHQRAGLTKHSASDIRVLLSLHAA